MEFISVTLGEFIGTITLNHDHKRNALGRGLINEVIAALTDLVEQQARVIVLRANKGAKSLVRGPRRRRIPPARPGPPVVRRSPGAGHPGHPALPGPGHRHGRGRRLGRRV